MSNINYICQQCGGVVELYSLGDHLKHDHGINTNSLNEARRYYDFGDQEQEEQYQEEENINLSDNSKCY